MDDPTTVTLSALHGGAVEELWQRELARVLENIADPNTPWKAKRTITVTVAINPSEDRDLGDLSIAVAAKVPGPKGVMSRLFFGRRQGKPIAVEQDLQQPGLFDAPDNGSGKITPLRREER